MGKDLRVGLVGCGYWGPNLARNLDSLSMLSALCDVKEDSLERMAKKYPQVNAFSDYSSMLNNEDLDAVCISTPPETHLSLGLEALENGKHVFIEKPLTMDTLEAQTLVDKVEDTGKIGMVGHTFLFNPAYRKLKDIVKSGAIGDVMAINVQRLNLGRFQPSGVVWDLMPHDLSMVLDLLPSVEVMDVYAEGYSVHPHHKSLDVARATLKLRNPNGGKDIVALLNSSWVYPNKVREFSVMGTKATVYFDDVASSRDKIRLFEDGVEKPTDGEINSFNFAYVYGDIINYAISGKEALHEELSHFSDCISERKKSFCDFRNGLEIVTLLDKIDYMARKTI